MSERDFTTIAITYSQPEAAVMLSMFAFYEIPAFAVGGGHAGADWPLVVALGGIEVRVLTGLLDDARALLKEVRDQPPAIRPPVVEGWLSRLVANTIGFLLGAPPPPRVATSYFLGSFEEAEG